MYGKTSSCTFVIIVLILVILVGTWLQIFFVFKHQLGKNNVYNLKSFPLTFTSDLLKTTDVNRITNHLLKYKENNSTTSNMRQELNDGSIPPVVKSWRQAKLDWHELLPIHNSVWERFGNPSKDGKFQALVSKEVLVTDYLTRFHESGLSEKYGRQYGPLLDYSGCNTLVSPCMIHDSDRLIDNIMNYLSS
jgi:hypothetical protein